MTGDNRENVPHSCLSLEEGTFLVSEEFVRNLHSSQCSDVVFFHCTYVLAHFRVAKKINLTVPKPVICICNTHTHTYTRLL